MSWSDHREAPTRPPPRLLDTSACHHITTYPMLTTQTLKQVMGHYNGERGVAGPPTFLVAVLRGKGVRWNPLPVSNKPESGGRGKGLRVRRLGLRSHLTAA